MLKMYRNWKMKKEKEAYSKQYGKAATLSYPPRYVTIGVTSRCSNRCVFCAYHAVDARKKSKVYNIKYDVAVDQYKKMVDFFYRGRVPKVHICGTGDPFFHPNILTLIDYTAKVYGNTSIQTAFPEALFRKFNFTDEIERRAKSISYITTDLFAGIGNKHDEVKRGASLEFTLEQLERLSQNTKIHFKGHFILTKDNYTLLPALVDTVHSRKIRCKVEVVNLHAYGFNEWTIPEKQYRSSDTEITSFLEKVKKEAIEKGVQIAIPEPVDIRSGICGSFWSRLQLWPVAGCDEGRAAENLIVGGCNAVVLGDMKSHGYLFDYKNVMEMWNNEHFLKIRKQFLAGDYPDPNCRDCRSSS